ncbi:uncharacterized protein LOC124667642 [Lolium rigidum]|uniref:uncharacterized protein LOC124667642 n=1 Tax=Lolium rigidum TaxID=89674 RepID=UPI001F5CE0D7|nr:uncharacterized protein LOC124667642 [Lolium rigidum]
MMLMLLRLLPQVAAVRCTAFGLEYKLLWMLARLLFLTAAETAAAASSFYQPRDLFNEETWKKVTSQILKIGVLSFDPALAIVVDSGEHRRSTVSCLSRCTMRC